MLLLLCIVSLLGLSNSFTLPSSNKSPYFFKGKLKMVNQELVNTANNLIYQGTIGTPWTYNDLLINLKGNNVEMATIIENINTVIALDKNFGDIITSDNLHAIKSVPHLTNTIIDKLNDFNVQFDILSYNTNGFFDFIPGPFNFLLCN